MDRDRSPLPWPSSAGGPPSPVFRGAPQTSPDQDSRIRPLSARPYTFVIPTAMESTRRASVPVSRSGWTFESAYAGAT